MNDTISVIIPVYNGERTIKETIQSILNQSFKDIEVIVVNDGSTDTTVEIVESFLDTRLRILSYPRAGSSASRNRGISHCKGQFISFIDADDLWTVDKLACQYQALQDHKNAAVAYSWTDYIDANGKFLKPGRRITATGDAYSKLLLWNFLENGSNPLLRREALNEVGGFDESLATSEDWDMWLRLSANYEFVCVDKVQILYRVSAHSKSTNLKEQEAGSLEVIERAFHRPKAQCLQHLKRKSLAHLYQYLLFKATETPADLQQKWIAAQFLWNCIKYNASIVQYQQLMLIAILKILFPQLYQRVNRYLSSKRLV